MLGIHSNHSKPNLKPVVDLDYHVRPCLPTAIIKTPKGEISFQRAFFKDFQRVEESMPRCWHLNTLALNMLALFPSILLFMVVFLLICHQCVWLLFLTFFGHFIFFWSLDKKWVLRWKVKPQEWPVKLYTAAHLSTRKTYQKTKDKKKPPLTLQSKVVVK